tara:strand:- start:12269 stop:12652 length:384 start_codon:yes stop_codon:yes gene_type:complete
MKKDWKHEIARDLMAFGSIIFYLIVLARSTIGEYFTFVYQLLIALALLTISSFIIKDANQRIARAFVLLIFTSLFYKDVPFTVFASLLWILMIGAAFYIKISKKSIYKGIVLGVITAIISYYLSFVV